MMQLAQTLFGNKLNGMSLQTLGAPVLVVMLLAMMILPLPPFALDFLFTFNIAMSLMILLAAVYLRRPLDFGVFPTVLLVSTLLRLALNVASTRVVLMRGQDGPGAAGHVIEAFGKFVVGGNYAVGLVVFAILVIINFVVVTKGAGRISEVTARFTLDAMPGKQMAIDADLSAGLIDQATARARRSEVQREASFHGAMDGASKFVRGDAIAGILVLFINMIGGFLIGVLQHNLSAAQAATNYILLTIGDGLVAQVPALLLSTAAALIVTRVNDSDDSPHQQNGFKLFENPRIFNIAGGMIAALGLIPGMPNLMFLLLGGSLLGGGRMLMLREREKAAAPSPEATAAQVPTEHNKELEWEDVLSTDIIGLEVGYRLISLVDQKQSGELLGRIKGVRKKLSQELGFLVHSVHIRDNLLLPPNGYRITLHDVPISEGTVHPGKEMAINPGQVFGDLDGIVGKDPAFSLDTVWIDASQREEAQTKGYTVVDCSTVIATHLSHTLKLHAYELIGHDEVQKLLDTLGKSAPKLVENLVPKTLTLGVVLKVMQNLLEENVPIKDIRSIAEALAAKAPNSQNPDDLTAVVRVALGRTICQGIVGMAPEIKVITLDPEMEQLLLDMIHNARKGMPAALEPGLADRLLADLRSAADMLEMGGQSPVLLTSEDLRLWMFRFTRNPNSNLKVLAYGEIPNGKQVKVNATIGKLKPRR
ncbi:MAG TPA: flagellar biosynthesis protein FlhA [Candidatus Acidoferrum sp.]|nr:flagellar biosynthesis protein FlhA [Candidatus Acidoferrum sp.]